jgi:hypothetical protein
MNREKLAKMAGSVRTGGKGSVRRWVAHPTAAALLYQSSSRLSSIGDTARQAADGNQHRYQSHTQRQLHRVAHDMLQACRVLSEISPLAWFRAARHINDVPT